MALPELPTKDKTLQRLFILDSIQNQRFDITRDFEAGFTMHVVEDQPEVAVSPDDWRPRGEYLRAYLVAVGPDDARLVLDDVMLGSDSVDLTQEIVWSSLEGNWDLVKREELE
jgi:hypothetical protein